MTEAPEEMWVRPWAGGWYETQFRDDPAAVRYVRADLYEALMARLAVGRAVELSVSPEMIERVLAEWEQEHPGKKGGLDMGEDEFARRMMIEVRASARMVPEAS